MRQMLIGTVDMVAEERATLAPFHPILGKHEVVNHQLAVFAEQVSPDPVKSAPAPTTAADAGANAAMPGASAPTLIEKLFGAR